MANQKIDEQLPLSYCLSSQRPSQAFRPTNHSFPSYPQDAENHQQHVQLEQVINDIDCAVRASFPKKPSQYDAVHVLLLRWEADDLQTSSEVEDLERVFQKTYGFKTETWLIPSASSHNSLNRRILDFQTDKSERDLLILYYGGHGIGDSHNFDSIWAATKSGYPRLRWCDIQTNLLNTNCDVLFIFDCCYASRHDIRGSDTYKGSKEVLAACSMEDVTIGVRPNSFTRRLIEELEKSHKDGDAYVSSWQIHDRLMGRKRRGHLQYTPRFFPLSQDEYPCIRLRPMKQRLDQSSSQASLTGQNKEESIKGVPSLDSSDTTSASSDWFTRERRIIVSINLDDPTKLPPVMQWERWLTEKAPENIKSMRVFFQPEDANQQRNLNTTSATPPDIPTYLDNVYSPGDRFSGRKRDVRLQDQFPIISQAMHKSDSTLLLLSIPIPVFKYLQRNPAYHFVGVIRSQNLLQQKRLSRPPSISLNVQEGLSKASRHWWWYKWYLGFLFSGLIWGFLTLKQLSKPAAMLAALISTILSTVPPLGLLTSEDSFTGPTDVNWFPHTPSFLAPEISFQDAKVAHM